MLHCELTNLGSLQSRFEASNNIWTNRERTVTVTLTLSPFSLSLSLCPIPLRFIQGPPFISYSIRINDA